MGFNPFCSKMVERAGNVASPAEPSLEQPLSATGTARKQQVLWKQSLEPHVGLPWGLGGVLALLSADAPVGIKPCTARSETL